VARVSGIFLAKGAMATSGVASDDQNPILLKFTEIEQGYPPFCESKQELFDFLCHLEKLPIQKIGQSPIATGNTPYCCSL
jgi:hypothetical protein